MKKIWVEVTPQIGFEMRMRIKEFFEDIGYTRKENDSEDLFIFEQQPQAADGVRK